MLLCRVDHSKMAVNDVQQISNKGVWCAILASFVHAMVLGDELNWSSVRVGCNLYIDSDFDLGQEVCYLCESGQKQITYTRSCESVLANEINIEFPSCVLLCHEQVYDTNAYNE